MGLVGYIGARPQQGERRRSVAVAAAFAVGIGISLLLIGVAASALGRLPAGWGRVFALATAVVSLAAGLAALFRPVLQRRVRVPTGSGVLGPLTYGLLYAVATITTSAGPLLLILTISGAIGRPVFGAAISLSYAIGRALPFLLLGAFAEVISRWITRMERARRIAEILSGLALIGLAYYFVTLSAHHHH